MKELMLFSDAFLFSSSYLSEHLALIKQKHINGIDREGKR